MVRCELPFADVAAALEFGETREEKATESLARMSRFPSARAITMVSCCGCVKDTGTPVVMASQATNFHDFYTQKDKFSEINARM